MDYAFAQRLETGRHDGLVRRFEGHDVRARDRMFQTAEVGELNAGLRFRVEPAGEVFPRFGRQGPQTIVRLDGAIRIQDFDENVRLRPRADAG